MNIFYSGVDKNLQLELDARAAAGTKNRSDRDLDYMLGISANVEISAFKGENAQTPVIQTIGGRNVREGRYLPGGEYGYLNETPYEQKSIEYNVESNSASTRVDKLTDASYRTGPFITTTTITIGDHSMGLLNKAVVNISIPNPLRDLDNIETVWFRPGRYVRIVIAHPDSAIITSNNNKMYPGAKGLLDKTIIPNRDKLKEFYPDLTASTTELEKFETQLRKMNYVMFEGVITSFDFSYLKEGTIEASISLTGTSNIYTDISMFMPTPASNKDTPKEKEKPKQSTNPVLDPKIDLTKRNTVLDELIQSATLTKTQADNLRNQTGETLKQTARTLGLTQATIDRLTATEINQSSSEFYDALNDKFPFPDETVFKGKKSVLINKNTSKTDQYYLVGEPYNQYTSLAAAATITNITSITPIQPVSTPPTPLLSNISNNFQRYITLGALIEFLNTYILTKLNTTVSNPKILCSDDRCYSTYYSELVSSNPWDVLLLDSTLQGNIRNSYGKTNFFDIHSIATETNTNWQGVSGNFKQVFNTNVFTSADNVFFPSRIFINMTTIKEIIIGTDGKSGITSGGKSSFTVKTFLSAISSKISQATGNAILMSLVTDPDPRYQSTLIFTDSKYVTKLDTEKNKKVEPYKVPMFANNPKGTLVRDFTLSAQLPENAKNLAYTLNGADKDGFEDEIAPYLNYMYQQNDSKSINATLQKYKENHKTIKVNLNVAKIAFGAFPKNPEKNAALRNALIKYIKYPTDDIKLSSLMTAPIFPFTAEFTIDGINGLRYGDVLTFEALPLRYRVNTVFSVISVTHTVSTEGDWSTQVKCIMRPSLD
jgi:hypothetical protein